MQNDLLVKRVPDRVVAPLSYSLKDLPCLLEAAPEPFLSGPAGDVHMGGTTPLVKNVAPAIVLLSWQALFAVSWELQC